jgi:chemotaxis protein methyltransferase CheR
MSAFLAEMDRFDEVRYQCELLLTVSISRFFRDPRVWQGLKENILPELMGVGKEKIKLWSAGCACGEEAYSFKIIWACLSHRYIHVPDLELIATDINPVYIGRARSGIYPSSSLKEVTPEILHRYFKQKGGKKLFEVKASLKRGITWKIHHLLSDPPGFNFDIIFLRNNILTYYEEELKTRAFGKIVDALELNGFLIIGCHETIPAESKNLIPVLHVPYVFRKV